MAYAKWFSCCLPLSALLAAAIILCPADGSQAHLSNYHKILGMNCVNKQYTRDFHTARSPGLCAWACNVVKDCQAFIMHHRGHCRLFVFHRCSKNVRPCDCSRLAMVYIKKQPGLPPGALCPAGYSNSRCGVAYRILPTNQNGFDAGMAKCNAENGLVLMTEPLDKGALHHVWALIHRNGYWDTFLGGRQDPGSWEPVGGWFWQTCRIPIDGGLWNGGEPNNIDGVEHIAFVISSHAALNDDRNRGWRVMCECVNPFEDI